MNQATEERFAALVHRTMAGVQPEESFLDRTLAAGHRRARRRRAAWAAGTLGVAALVATGVAATGLPAPTDRATSAGAPSPSGGAATLRLPTPAELTDRLAAALPGPSAPVSAGRIGGRVQVERRYDGVAVTALAYDVAAVTGRPFDAAQAAALCTPARTAAGPTRCTVTDDGWAISVVARPDTAGATTLPRAARVTYYRRDGHVVDLAVAEASAIPRARLVALATSDGWLPVA